MFSSVKVVLAAVVMALAGGFVLMSSLTQQERAALVGAERSEDADGPAVHWHSSVVDLQADSVTLQVGDETHTAEGVDVVVDSEDGDLRSWALQLGWMKEGETTLWMNLNFASDGEDWRAHPLVIREGVVGRGHDKYRYLTEPDYLPENAFVSFPMKYQIRMPLGQPYEGDWVLTERLEVPTCDRESSEMIEVTLTFENLRLSVSPRQPTVFDELADDWFHRGSLLGDLVKGPLEPPESRLLECPKGAGEPRSGGPAE